MGDKQYYGTEKWIRVKKGSFKCRTCQKNLAPAELAGCIHRLHDVIAFGKPYP